ncbi:hypothetical protein RSK20926_21714 [Roseobacter sp. SK209-2-6]|uniref:hypothetical protein n=1 Tax=Roseobacter sp. SK209-2-6 TaxID=388739 RepID=UPI0000F3F48B|nr:hypothetical protein [Roseobacter sp. SK209-2-6]EBA16386.1 hypothetical protein RSK20926_21714 [Roseobacter sp. SK209-2-6]
MAMTEEQIRKSIREGFRLYATRVNTASLVLDSRLALTEAQLELTNLHPGLLAQVAHDESSPIVDRLVNRILELHPFVPLIATSS